MSTNLRKAQKHMQRARELLNQGQLGFGVNTDQKENQLQKLPDELMQLMSTNLSCKHHCMMSLISTEGYKNFSGKCHECMEGATLAKNANVRLKSITTPMASMLQEEHKIEFDLLQKNNLGIPLTADQLDMVRNIDITVNIQELLLRKSVQCNLVQDNNQNLTKYLNSSGQTKYIDKFKLSVIQKNENEEYWVLHFQNLIFCHTALKKTEIQEWYVTETQRQQNIKK